MSEKEWGGGGRERGRERDSETEWQVYIKKVEYEFSLVELVYILDNQMTNSFMNSLTHFTKLSWVSSLDPQ